MPLAIVLPQFADPVIEDVAVERGRVRVKARVTGTVPAVFFARNTRPTVRPGVGHPRAGGTAGSQGSCFLDCSTANWLAVARGPPCYPAL